MAGSCHLMFQRLLVACRFFIRLGLLLPTFSPTPILDKSSKDVGHDESNQTKERQMLVSIRLMHQKQPEEEARGSNTAGTGNGGWATSRPLYAIPTRSDHFDSLAGRLVDANRRPKMRRLIHSDSAAHGRLSLEGTIPLWRT